MRITYFVFTGSLIISGMVHGQELISTGGDLFLNNAEGSLSFSIGEPVGETLTGSGYILTQGFQQSKLVINTIKEDSVEGLIVKAFPNPAKDNVFITISNAGTKKINCEILDQEGKIVLKKELTPGKTELTLKPLSGGMYILNIKSDNQIHKVYKIIKQ